MNQLTDLRKSYDWINDVPRCVSENCIKRIDKAHERFLTRKSGFPKFAKKGFYNSITFKQSVWVKGDIISASKIGSMKMFKDSSVNGKIKYITIKKEITGYYACLSFQVV